MEIKHERTGHRGKFYIDLGGKTVAVLTYTMAGDDRMIIDHTEVGEELQGRGAGKLLVEKAIAYATERAWKITPLCPFTKKVMEKEEKYKSLIS